MYVYAYLLSYKIILCLFFLSAPINKPKGTVSVTSTITSESVTKVDNLSTLTSNVEIIDPNHVGCDSPMTYLVNFCFITLQATFLYSTHIIHMSFHLQDLHHLHISLTILVLLFPGPVDVISDLANCHL